MRTKENTLILKSKRMKFKDLLLKLYVHSKGGFLHDVLMNNCLVTDCPKDSQVIQRFKHKGRWVELFCGFFCEKGVVIEGNVFSPNKKIPKRK